MSFLVSATLFFLAEAGFFEVFFAEEVLVVVFLVVFFFCAMPKTLVDGRLHKCNRLDPINRVLLR